MKEKQPRVEATGPTATKERPPYEIPRVTTYTEAELLEALGPAQAGGYSNPFGS